MKSVKHTVVLMMILLLPLVSHAFIVFDPTNYGQNIITARNSVTLLIQQSKQLQSQIESLKLQFRNVQHLKAMNWRDMEGLIKDIDRISQQKKAISYAMVQFEQAFQRQYPNYHQSHELAPYRMASRTWDNTTLSTLQNALAAMGEATRQDESEAELMAKLKRQNQSASGQLQVLQVANELNAENIHQMQIAKRMMALQMNAQTAYMAQITSKHSYEMQSLFQLADHLPTGLSRREKSSGFGLIE